MPAVPRLPRNVPAMNIKRLPGLWIFRDIWYPWGSDGYGLLLIQALLQHLEGDACLLDILAEVPFATLAGHQEFLNRMIHFRGEGTECGEYSIDVGHYRGTILADQSAEVFGLGVKGLGFGWHCW